MKNQVCEGVKRSRNILGPCVSKYSIKLAGFPSVKSLILTVILNTQVVFTDKLSLSRGMLILHKNQLGELGHIFEV